MFWFLKKTKDIPADSLCTTRIKKIINISYKNDQFTHSETLKNELYTMLLIIRKAIEKI